VSTSGRTGEPAQCQAADRWNKVCASSQKAGQHEARCRGEQRCIGSSMMYNWALSTTSDPQGEGVSSMQGAPRSRGLDEQDLWMLWDDQSKTGGSRGLSMLCSNVRRDASAARNILLRYLAEHASPTGIDHLLQQQQPSSREGGTFEPCLPRPRSLRIQEVRTPFSSFWRLKYDFEVAAVLFQELQEKVEEELAV